MAKFVCDLLIVWVFLNTSLASGESISLICPVNYNPTGQAWYAEAPYNYIANRSKKDFTKELIAKDAKFKPTKYSICVICTRTWKHFEVELCIGHNSLRDTNLVYERRNSTKDGGHDETLVWSTVEPVAGLIIDLSRGDLLATLKNITPVKNLSLKYLYLNCPAGFQLEKLQQRRLFSEEKFQRPCIQCSKGQYTFSSCISKDQNVISSGFFPTLHGSSDKCKNECPQNVNKMFKEKPLSCGVYMDPWTFSAFFSNIQTENIRSDCSNNDLKGYLHGVIYI